MQFFKNLTDQLTDGQLVTITLLRSAENKLTLNFLPQIKDKALAAQLQPLSMNGTPEEFDAEFFDHVKPVMEVVNGLQSNVEQIKATDLKPSGKKTESEDDEDEDTGGEKTKPAKSSPKKKAPAKPAKKEVKKTSEKAATTKSSKPAQVPPLGGGGGAAADAPISEADKAIIDGLDEKGLFEYVADISDKLDMTEQANLNLLNYANHVQQLKFGNPQKKPKEITKDEKKQIQKMLASELDKYISDLTATHGQHPEDRYAHSCLNFAQAEQQKRTELATKTETKPEKPIQNLMQFGQE